MRHSTLLWTIRGLLALLFLFAGGVKLVLPLDALAGPVALPGWFIRFLGVAEVAGAAGLVLPGLLQVREELTAIAAGGLAVIMIGATVITVMSGSALGALFPALVGALACVIGHSQRRRLVVAAVVS